MRVPASPSLARRTNPGGRSSRATTSPPAALGPRRRERRQGRRGRGRRGRARMGGESGDTRALSESSSGGSAQTRHKRGSRRSCQSAALPAQSRPASASVSVLAALAPSGYGLWCSVGRGDATEPHCACVLATRPHKPSCGCEALSKKAGQGGAGGRGPVFVGRVGRLWPLCGPAAPLRIAPASQDSPGSVVRGRSPQSPAHGAKPDQKGSACASPAVGPRRRRETGKPSARSGAAGPGAVRVRYCGGGAHAGRVHAAATQAARTREWGPEPASGAVRAPKAGFTKRLAHLAGATVPG